MEMGLSESVVVVTGAASGIGRAIASELIENGVAALVLTDRDGPGCERAAASLGGKARRTCVVADLEEAGAATEIASAAKAAFGRIDGLVNAAAITTRGSFQDGTVDLWDRMFAVNARAPFLLMQAAIADMRLRQAPGAIVNILSMNAYCGKAELAVYSASKGALATLTRNAANAHLRDRIRVNGINLGWVATATEHRMQAEILGRGPGWLATEEAKMPLGRLVTAEETARLAVFLLGGASVPMTGTVIDFDQRVMGSLD